MLIFISFVYLALSLSYVWLIYHIYSGWKATPALKIFPGEAVLGISVILAARNERAYISACIESILGNEYPKDQFEIIVIDDHSTDDTKDVFSSVNMENVRYFHQKPDQYGKKAAIAFGITQAKYPIIVCTDADSIVSKWWLKSHACAYTLKQHKITTGLVLPKRDGKLIADFQWFDFAATMAITANGIYRNTYYLANGANLSYSKSGFEEVNGFEGSLHLSSGDDVFLMSKIACLSPEAASFLKAKESIVITKSEGDWTSFFNQRKRWATKAMYSGNKTLILIQSFVFVFTVCLLLGLLCSFTFYPGLLPIVLLAFFTKMITDYLFLYHLAKYFEEKTVMRSFPMSFLIYFVHIILSAWYALFPSSYEWKKRETN